MKYVVLVKPNGEITAEPVDKDNFLAWLQTLVGGYVEIIRSCDMLTDKQRMIVNEDGKLKGLPYNPVASTIFGATILGNAVIVRKVCDDIAAYQSKEFVNRRIIAPLKYRLAQTLEAADGK